MVPKVTEYLDFCMYAYIFAIKIFLGKKGPLVYAIERKFVLTWFPGYLKGKVT